MLEGSKIPAIHYSLHRLSYDMSIDFSEVCFPGMLSSASSVNFQ
jgi:hypothetical protein